MSQYLQVFIQSPKNENDFIPIGCYCASSEMYHLFKDYAPFEHIKELSINYLKDKINDLKSDLVKSSDSLKNYEKQINFIQKCNNSLSDKFEEYFEINKHIDEEKEYLDEKRNAISILSHLIEICSDSIDEDDWNKRLKLFVGIECGYNVTLEDIEEE